MHVQYLVQQLNRTWHSAWIQHSLVHLWMRGKCESIKSCSETDSPLERQKFLFIWEALSGGNDALRLFLQGGVSASLGGFHITCFYSLMVQINSSLIHGVIVGSCPEMDLAQWSGQPLRPHVTIIWAQWEYLSICLIMKFSLCMWVGCVCLEEVYTD